MVWIMLSVAILAKKVIPKSNIIGIVLSVALTFVRTAT